MMKLTMVLLISVLSVEAYSESLTDVEILYRCYGHLTSKRLKSSDPLLKQVKAGQVSGVAACERILATASLKTNGLLVSDSREARSVLSTMTKLHMSFFEKQALTDANNIFTRVTKDVYDEQSSALHYTKALFDKNHGVDDIFKASKDIEGRRTDAQATGRGPASNILASNFTRTGPSGTKVKFTPNFVMTGDLIGLRDARALDIPMSTGSGEHGTDIRSTIGGGLLGTRAYLKRSISSTNSTRSDGALSMNRLWANTVLKDFLCKSLPAVRLADGQPYKKQNANTPAFRKTDGCIQCHATMDQLAAGGRGLTAANLTRDNSSNTNPQLRYHYDRKPDRAKASDWPAERDADYYRRPASGTLYFRSHSGDLINKPFNDFNQLAENMLETDDYYSCVAKKYYEHFTGVSASLADINDPFSNIILNEQDLFHRNKVIELGKELRKNKDPMSLIKSIFNSKVYQQKGFTILGDN
jgi:hypothetical protein